MGPPADGAPPSLKAEGKEGAGTALASPRHHCFLSPANCLWGAVPLQRHPVKALPFSCSWWGWATHPRHRRGKGAGDLPPPAPGGRWIGRIPATLVHRGAPSPGSERDRLNAFRLYWCAGVPCHTAPEGRERDASRPSLVRRGGVGEPCPTEAAEERAASLFYWHREETSGRRFHRRREEGRGGQQPTPSAGKSRGMAPGRPTGGEEGGKWKFYPPSWKRGERHPHRHGGKTGGGLPCRHKAEPRADKPPLARQKKRGVCVPPRRHRETGRAANRPHRRREKRG